VSRCLQACAPDLLLPFEQLLTRACAPEVIHDLVAPLGERTDPEHRAMIEEYLTLLGSHGIACVIEVLTWLEPMENRQLLCSVLAHMSLGHAELLRAGFEHELWYVARNMCYTLGLSQDASGVPLLYEALRHAEPRVRLEAVRTLAKIGPQDLVANLAPLLHDRSDATRRAALLALAGTGDKASAVLCGLLSDPWFDEWSSEEKSLALQAVASTRTDEAAESLWHYLSRAGGETSRAADLATLLAAVSVLELMKTRRAVECIVDLYNNGPKRVKMACGDAIRRIRSQLGKE